MTPQTLATSLPSVNFETKKPQTQMSEPVKTHAQKRLAGVGFQSILETHGLERSRNSVFSDNSESNAEEQIISLRPNDSTSRISINKSKSSSFIQVNKSSLFPNLHLQTSGSVQGQDISQSSNLSRNRNHSFRDVARKFLHLKHTSKKNQVNETQTNTFSKFLYAQHGRGHKNNNNANITESNKSLYSLNQSEYANLSESTMNPGYNFVFESVDIQMLYDLIKNMPSLETSFNQFTAQEQNGLMSNIWGVYCNFLLSVFRNQRVWQLPAKIEDINRVLNFYIRIKQQGKTYCLGSKFLNEIKDCIRTGIHVLESHILYIHGEEGFTKTGIKRLCAVWDAFYNFVFTDAMAVLEPLEASFKTSIEYWNTNEDEQRLELGNLINQIFRDTIVIPYYQKFMNYQTCISKQFQSYISEEEEANGITKTEKLTLLQCFGLLSSIDCDDANQKIIKSLLIGLRMSM